MASVSNSTPFSLTSETSTWKKVKASATSTYAIDTNNYLFAWGLGTNGQLGDGTIVNKSSPVQIGTPFTESSLADYAAGISLSLNSWTVIATGLSTTAAVTSDGSLFTWGLGINGELGTGAVQPVSFPTKIGSSSWSTVCAGVSHFAAIRSDGKLFAWGNNSSGQLGLNDLVHRSSPVQIGTNSYTSVSAGASNTSAIDSTYKLWTWGNNAIGQLGTDDIISRSSPIQIGSNSWTQVSTGNSITAAVDSTGSLYTWGAAAAGQVGQGILAHRSSPVQVATISGNESAIDSYVSAVGYSGTVYYSWIAVTSGAVTDLAIRSDGTLWGWGLGSDGSLGLNNTANYSIPTLIGNNSWSQISSNDGATYGITSTGLLFAWGVNTYGSLGTNDTIDQSSPVQIGTSSWIAIASGGIRGTGLFAAAIRSDGALFTWGVNTNGQLGSNTILHRSSPTQVGTSSWTTVGAGASYISAIRSDRALFTWGANGNGELGSNARVHRSSPVQVGTSSWNNVTSGFNHTLATLTTGALFTWGFGTLGQLGSGARLSRSSPVQVGTSSWSKVGAGTSWSLAIRTDGALFSWGSNAAGNLGLGDLVHRSSPVQIGSSSWTTISTNTVSNSAPMAIRSDGRLFIWGQQYNGDPQLYPLPNLRFNSILSPIVVTTYTDSFNTASAGTSHIAAIRTDGKLFTWGLNTSGQLGDGTVVSRSAPVQVGASNWSNVSAGGTHTVALNSSSNLFAWGLNTLGQLGTADIINRSSPVQIGSSVYSEIETSLNSSYAKKLNYTLYGWGQNLGQLGTLGLVGNQSSPVLVGAPPTKWDSVGQGLSFAIGIRSDKLLFTWGLNTNGQLSGTPGVSRSNPTQMGSGLPPGYYSNYFNGSSYLSIADNVAWSFGSGDFTIEGWVFSSSVYSGRIYNQYQSSTNQISIQLGSNQIRFFQYTGGTFNPDLTSSGTLTVGQWNHFAVVRNGNVFTIYINGVSNGSQTSSITLTDFAAPITISSYNGVAEFFTGYISNYRIVKGTAVYTANFTPPTSPLTAIPNTVLLTCQNIFFVDNSVNNFSITATGNPTGDTSYPTSFSAPSEGSGNMSWSTVTAGSLYSAAITQDKLLFSWGDNTNGQLGIESGYTPQGAWTAARSSPVQVGTTTYAASPTQVGSSSWATVSSGTKHVLATRNDGAMFAWGLNNNYQLGDTTQTHRSSPVQIGTSSWSQVSAGDSHSLGIASDSTLYGWGPTGYSSLTTPYLLPYLQSQGNYYIAVRGAFDWAIALKNDGSLWAWGDNSSGALGLNNTITRSSPVQIGTSSWSQIGVGTSTAYAIRADGALFAWGINTDGNLGDNSRINKSSPVQIGTESWLFLGNGGYAIKLDGSLWAWGNNNSGQLGQLDRITRSSPVQIGTSSWSLVTGSSDPTSAVLGLRIDGALFSWGASLFGAGGQNIDQPRSSPTQVGTSSWSFVATNGNTTYGIRSDGSLFTWGYNNWGELGDNTRVNKSSPVQIGTSLYKFASPANYGNLTTGFGFAIRNDGALFATGFNTTGQLGLGNVVTRSSPVQVGTSSWSQVYAGSSFAVGILADGSLYTWGQNTIGYLGSNNTISRSSPGLVGAAGSIPSFFSQPVQISTSSWTQVSAGYSHSLALKSDSTMWGWGGPAANTFTTYSWLQVSASIPLVLLIKQDGALFSWGSTPGDNTIISKSSPVQIGTSSWSFVSAGISSGMAIRKDGGLFAWGNNSGNLGDNTVIPRSSPVQIGTASYVWVNTEGGVATAIRNDGTLWVWGSMTNGQEGKGVTGTAAVRSSPVQTGTNVGTSWKESFITGYSTYAIRDDGLLYAWGFSTTLGDNGGPTNPNPILVTSLNTESDYIAYITDNSIPTYSWVSISAGYSYSVAVRSDGALFTFGNSTDGAAGDNSTYTKNYPTKIGTSSWVVATAGLNHIAAIRSDGGLFTWGQNTNGQLGDNSIVPKSSPTQIGTSSWTQVIAGGLSTYAIAPDGGLFAWGANGLGQLGDNTNVSKSSPVKIGTDSWTQIGAASSYALGINSTGILYAWGADTGDGTVTSKSRPVQITSLNTPALEFQYASAKGIPNYSWSQISSNVSHIVAIRSDKLLFAWGLNNAGQLGDNTILGKSSPIQIGTSSWTSVATGLSFTTAIRSDGTLWSWGVNTNGMLGLNDIVSRSSPVQVGTSNTWKSLQTQGYNSSHMYAIDNNDLIYAWGLNSSGQLGLNDVNARSSPVQVGSSSWSLVSTGTNYTLAIRNDGGLFTFGAGANGVLGNNTVTNRSSPTQVGTSSWSQVSAGLSYSFALRTDGGLFTWGGNSGGQLGLNDRTDRSSPVQIGTSSWVALASGGGYGQFAIRQDGGLFAWGNNTNGGLGVGNTITRSSPVQIGTSSWSVIGCGNTNTSVGLTADGTLYTWGNNANGLLGTLKNYSSTSSPVFVNTINDSWSSVGTGAASVSSGAIRDDGKLFMWGLNTNGQLGLGDSVHRSNPVQIGDSSWTSIGLGLSHTVARSGNSVFAWGGNSAGQLGQNDTVARSSPIQIGTVQWTSVAAGSALTFGSRTDNILFGMGQKLLLGETKSLPASYSSPVVIRTTLDTWKHIAVGISPGAGAGQHVIGIRSDDKLFAWGSNAAGQLGLGDITGRNNPTQVGNSSWIQIAANASSTSAVRSDGKLFVWGLGTSGQLGFNDNISRSSPVQLSTTSWSVISQGPSFAKFAIRQEDGVAYASGTGVNGEPTRSSPVQIGTPYGYLINPTNYSNISQIGSSSWTAVSAGNNYSMAIRSTDNVLFTWGFNAGAFIKGSVTNTGYSATQISSGTSHFSFIKNI